jgi:flavin reductase (DIM6/NTAB) family NADH-FMN oxidoreductase RutF
MNIDKFKDTQYTSGITGAPIVMDYTLAYFEAEVINQFDIATHTVFIGKIVGAETVQDGIPMTYDHYHKIKGGLTPKNAPTYIANTPPPVKSE